MGIKRKYYRPFPNRDRVAPLDKKIPFNSSISRRVVLSFIFECEQAGLDKNNILEEFMLDFCRQIKKD
jgi:hypothetical protein